MLRANNSQYEFYGKGWSFPVNPSTGSFTGFIGGEEKIRQSIWIILSTAPGERQMRPAFGCGIHDLLFQPNTVTFRTQVENAVREALVRWEPRIDVMNVDAEAPVGEPNVLLIQVDYRIRTNNAFHNLVFPFFLDEGAERS